MSFKDIDVGGAQMESTWVKHDNREGKGFFCGDDDVGEINFVADFPACKIGWGKYDNKTYFKEWQENISTPHAKESELKVHGYKRAFQLYLYSSDKGVKLWERDSAMEWSGFLEIAKAYENDKANRGDKLPVIGYEGAEGVDTKNGKFYKPVFKVKGWVDRPTEFIVPSDTFEEKEVEARTGLTEEDLPF